MSTALASLPSTAKARLPVSYQSARTALAECARIDECKDWADKAESLASYAKQAGDETLRKTADRIQARAIQRCGQLLKAIKPAKNQHACVGGGISRSQAATDAKLSTRQKNTALRVASVDDDEFEEAVESNDPPTVTKLAERGKKPRVVALKGHSPADFKACTNALGALRSLLKTVHKTDPAAAARGASAKAVDRMAVEIPAAIKWLSTLLEHVSEKA